MELTVLQVGIRCGPLQSSLVGTELESFNYVPQ